MPSKKKTHSTKKRKSKAGAPLKHREKMFLLGVQIPVTLHKRLTAIAKKRGVYLRDVVVPALIKIK